eukprot:TRINITY_DN5686_c0_g1_i1.p1 TRINITY_DN5686_c0_g1~~TRINITY_DN5686_c0_g1_i1.p1  ORF type:complete len:391 (-),score=63.69 TRINITY_DN5686_c0_g1_i1:44-1216(-)
MFSVLKFLSSSPPTVDPQLHVVYHGKVRGRMPENSGVITSNHQPFNPEKMTLETSLPSKALSIEPRLLEALKNSLGTEVEDLHVIKEFVEEPFEIQAADPSHINFQPIFLNRGNEYGPNHTYLESMCHGRPERKFVTTSNARYFGIETTLPPSNVELTAFVEAVRRVNQPFFTCLQHTLLGKGVNEVLVNGFLDGAFRSLAIQLHFGEASNSVAETSHMDHVFSCLHMAITLHGERTVGFEVGFNQFLKLPMKPGDVYVTSPAGIIHGISFAKLSTDQRSMAVQFRSLMSADIAKLASEPKTLELILSSVSFALMKFPIVIPTYDQWVTYLLELFPTADTLFSEQSATNPSKSNLFFSSSSPLPKTILPRRKPQKELPQCTYKNEVIDFL